VLLELTKSPKPVPRSRHLRLFYEAAVDAKALHSAIGSVLTFCQVRSGTELYWWTGPKHGWRPTVPAVRAATGLTGCITFDATSRTQPSVGALATGDGTVLALGAPARTAR